jgi:hypothetical protein
MRLLRTCATPSRDRESSISLCGNFSFTSRRHRRYNEHGRWSEGTMSTKENSIYRFHLLDHREHLIECQNEICLDDADANTRAKHLAGDHTVEVWHSRRLIGRWERSES